MMKSFLRGRTETGRPVTKDMRQFVESMEDILLPPVKKAEMLRTASKAHTAQISGCSVLILFLFFIYPFFVFLSDYFWFYLLSIDPFSFFFSFFFPL